MQRCGRCRGRLCFDGGHGPIKILLLLLQSRLEFFDLPALAVDHFLHFIYFIRQCAGTDCSRYGFRPGSSGDLRACRFRSIFPVDRQPAKIR